MCKIFYQNDWLLRNRGPLKIGLIQCHEVLWIHNIDAICNIASFFPVDVDYRYFFFMVILHASSSTFWNFLFCMSSNFPKMIEFFPKTITNLIEPFFFWKYIIRQSMGRLWQRNECRRLRTSRNFQSLFRHLYRKFKSIGN